MEKYNLIKIRDGQRSGIIQSYFYGDNRFDKKMISGIEDYLKIWLNSYNNSLTTEEIDNLFENFDGEFCYDVYSFKLEKEDE